MNTLTFQEFKIQKFNLQKSLKLILK